MKFLFSLLFLGSISLSSAQQNKLFVSQDLIISEWIEGTLLLPIDKKEDEILAIIISDFGPTDRNGNQSFMKSNCLKQLAESLSAQKIASFRYDKRIVKQIRTRKPSKQTTFDDLVTDAIDVINYFKSRKRFKKIVVVGHGQGSLVGMIAAKNKADAFVSIAGTAYNIGDVIIREIKKTAPVHLEKVKYIIGKLKSGRRVGNYPKELTYVLNSKIQPYMISWMKHDPQKIIQDLNIPVLIVNGTKDLQVNNDEGLLLKKANKNAELIEIKNMNHVLFEIDGNDLENSKSYNESFRKISKTLINGVKEFITS